MPTLSPNQALWLADAILTLHVGIVIFVVGLLPLVLIGGALGWRWVRHLGLRLTHLALMLFIAAQAWLGQLCPLTCGNKTCAASLAKAATAKASSNTGWRGCCTGTRLGGCLWRGTRGLRWRWGWLGFGSNQNDKDGPRQCGAQ
ncbi:MAG: DUF2784 family protein [Hydrogenophaga sp.]|nr:DUF2784 family protein [Hydrogenophaga sp.]MDP1685414.1 DUF2784 family protein [Hydrogenophaga sp.]